MIGGIPFIAVVHVVKLQFLDQPMLLEEVQGIVDGRLTDSGGLFPCLSKNGKSARVAPVTSQDCYDFQALGGELEPFFPESFDY
jgi:hypothetical protein